MNLSKIKPLAIFGIVILIVILLGAILTGLIFRKEKVPTAIEYRPTIPPDAPKKLQQSSKFDQELAKIKPLLPISGSNYKIEYLRANLVMVTIDVKTKTDYLATKQKVEQQIKSKGITDICSLKVFWLAPKDAAVRKSLTPKDLTTTGCSPD